jgi:hypothetical protein
MLGQPIHGRPIRNPLTRSRLIRVATTVVDRADLQASAALVLVVVLVPAVLRSEAAILVIHGRPIRSRPRSLLSPAMTLVQDRACFRDSAGLADSAVAVGRVVRDRCSLSIAKIHPNPIRSQSRKVVRDRSVAGRNQLREFRRLPLVTGVTRVVAALRTVRVGAVDSVSAHIGRRSDIAAVSVSTADLADLAGIAASVSGTVDTPAIAGRITEPLRLGASARRGSAGVA